MLTHPFNPYTEKTTLYNAIMLFRERWEQRRTMNAVFDLCDAIERAEDVILELQQCKPTPQSDLALVAINLQLLIGIARNVVANVQNEMLEAIGHRMAKEERQPQVSSSPVLPAGTILSVRSVKKDSTKSLPVRVSMSWCSTMASCYSLSTPRFPSAMPCGP